VTAELRDQGQGINEKKVARVMRKDETPASGVRAGRPGFSLIRMGPLHTERENATLKGVITRLRDRDLR
jgi:hypothetical protein